MKRFICIALTITVLAVIFCMRNVMDRLHYHYYGKAKPESSLSRYELKETITIPGIANLSGVVYNPEHQSLMMVLNNPEVLLECDLNGKILRRIRLEGFQDTEGICYNDDGRLVVTEERKQTLVTLPPIKGLDIIRRQQALSVIELSMFSDHNYGLEGVSYSQHHQSFFIAKEKEPAAVLQLSRSPTQPSLKRLFQLSKDQLRINDISGIFCRDNGNLLLLSDESAVVVESNLAGEVQGYLELDQGLRGGDDRIPQAEGICLDDEKNLYIVSEPNLLYIFRPK